MKGFQRVGPHLALLAANICWGGMSPVTKGILLRGELGALPLAALRIGGGALLFMLLGWVLPGGVAPREKVSGNDLLKLFLASMLIISANQGLFIMGIAYTNPVDSAVMSSLTPLLTMLLAALVLGFPITWAKGAGVILGLAGVVMLVATGNVDKGLAPNTLLGDALCFAAQLCAAVYYVVFLGLMKRYHPFTIMKWMFLFGALTFVPLCLPQLAGVDFGRLGWLFWAEMGYIILFATVFAYLTLPYAQKRLRPTVVSIYNYFQPVVAGAVAVWLGVGEITAVKVMAVLLIFTGVWFVNRGR